MSKPAYPSDQQDKFMLRLPDGMRDRIKAAAERNNRSMNAEIVSRLEQSFAPPVNLPSDEVELTDEEWARMDRIMHEFAELLVNRRQRSPDPDD